MWELLSIWAWPIYLSPWSGAPPAELAEQKAGQASGASQEQDGQATVHTQWIGAGLDWPALLSSPHEEDQKQALAYIARVRDQRAWVRKCRASWIAQASGLPRVMATLIEAYTPSGLNLEDDAQKTPLDHLPRGGRPYRLLREAGATHSQGELEKALLAMGLLVEHLTDQTPYQLALQGQKIKIWLVLQHPCLKSVALPGQPPCTDLRDPWALAGRLYTTYYKAPELPCGLSHDILGLF